VGLKGRDKMIHISWDLNSRAQLVGLKERDELINIGDLKSWARLVVLKGRD
jgi:hypothetical protein